MHPTSPQNSVILKFLNDLLFNPAHFQIFVDYPRHLTVKGQYRAFTADHKLFFPLHTSAFFPLFMSFINIHQTNTIIHFKIKTK